MGKISDYTRVLAAKLADVFVVDQTDNGTTETKSATVEQIGTAIGTLQNFADLDTSNKNLVDAINEIASYTPVYGNTASGAIATFDTSLALPLQDCTIDINAVQESGTPTPSSPKLISGFTGANIKVAGKNLIDFLSDLKSSSNGLSISIDNGGIKFVNQPTASWADLSNTISVFLPKGTYTFSRTTSATYNVYIDVIFEDSTTATMSITSGTTSRTATYTKNIIGVKLRLSGLSTSTTYNETIYLQFEEGSVATTYEAYNGNTTLVDWGINQWNEQWELGSLDISNGAETPTTSRGRNVGFISVIGGSTLYVSKGGNGSLYLLQYDANQNYLNIYNNVTNSTITLNANCRYIRFYTDNAYGATYNNDISINYPATITDYHAYIADGAGIVYGGSLDVTTGLLTVTHGITTINDCINNRTTSYTNPVFYGAITGLKPQTASVLCDYFNVISGKSSTSAFANTASNYDFAINSANTGSSIQVFLRCDDYTDVSTLKTNCGSAVVVYELATPVTYQLTPTQINAIVGTNNVFTDTNGNTSVVYACSLKDYIEGQ